MPAYFHSGYLLPVLSQKVEIKKCLLRNFLCATALWQKEENSLCALFCAKLNAPLCQLAVARLFFVAEIMAARLQRRYGCAAAAHKWVQDHVIWKGIEIDQPPGQLNWEGRRVADFCCAGCADMPNTFCKKHKLLLRHFFFDSWLGMGRPNCFLQKTENVFVIIPQDRIAGQHLSFEPQSVCMTSADALCPR